MDGNEWIIGAIGAIGVPLVVGWLRSSIEKGDKAQQRILDDLERKVERIEEVCSAKANITDTNAILLAVKSIESKLENLNNQVLVELGRRPTREEVMSLMQNGRHGNG